MCLLLSGDRGGETVSKKWNLLDWLVATIRYRQVLNNIDLDKNSTIVCDIGCGMTGCFLRSIASDIKYGYGIDRKVKARKYKNVLLKQVSDIQTGIPLADESVDYVFMIAVLEHLDKTVDMVREVYRVLKPTGCLIVTTPTKIAKPVLEFMAFKLHIISESEILDHKHYFTRCDICKLLARCGLDDNWCYRKFLMGFNSYVCVRKVK